MKRVTLSLLAEFIALCEQDQLILEGVLRNLIADVSGIIHWKAIHRLAATAPMVLTNVT